MNQYIHLKSDVEISDILHIQPELLWMISFSARFCADHGIKFMVSSIFREEGDGSISKTHQTGRAFDISLNPVWGWTEELVKLFESEINKTFERIGSLVKCGDGFKSVPIYLHDAGSGYHAHLQVRP